MVTSWVIYLAAMTRDTLAGPQDGAPTVQPVGGIGATGSLTAQVVTVGMPQIVEDAPAAKLIVPSWAVPSSQSRLTAHVPVKPEGSGSRDFVLLRGPVGRVLVKMQVHASSGMTCTVGEAPLTRTGAGLRAAAGRREHRMLSTRASGDEGHSGGL
jgi:hypothetical protein